MWEGVALVICAICLAGRERISILGVANIADSQRIYERNRDDLLARELSNSQMYDQSILTLSSGALGLSLAFIRFGLPKSTAYLDFLYLSWALFVVAIVAVIGSFLVGQMGITDQIQLLDDAHETSEECKTTHFAKWVRRFNGLSGGSFIGGAISLTLFVFLTMRA